ncbi:hypothetical protein BC826DRAFT_562267 [Russula brevipes]|nr:hypothetical protein BC826DRAFT_562267 [Russula brevipes]
MALSLLTDCPPSSIQTHPNPIRRPEMKKKIETEPEIQTRDWSPNHEKFLCLFSLEIGLSQGNCTETIPYRGHRALRGSSTFLLWENTIPKAVEVRAPRASARLLFEVYGNWCGGRSSPQRGLASSPPISPSPSPRSNDSGKDPRRTVRYVLSL